MNKQTFKTISRNVRLDGGRTTGIFNSYGFHGCFDGETLSFVRCSEAQLRGVCLSFLSDRPARHSKSERRAMVNLSRNIICDVRVP